MASSGQLAGAGGGVRNAIGTEQTAAPVHITATVANLSGMACAIAFHDACATAAASTASVTES